MKSMRNLSNQTMVIVLSFFLLSPLGVKGAGLGISDTGLTKCYNNVGEITCPSSGEDFYGQDANYEYDKQSFTKLDAQGNILPVSAVTWSMVQDNITGLTWGGYNISMDWVKAKAWITELNNEKYKGHSNWRLASIKELESIVDYSEYNPTINPIYFQGLDSYKYWASDERISSFNNNEAWYLDFENGYTFYGDKTDKYHCLVVRGQDVPSTYTVDDDEITDNATGLVWQKTTSGPMTWEKALEACENSGWRLPTIRELMSIVDYSKSNPAIDEKFSTESGYYWSSVTRINPKKPETLQYAWLQDFQEGVTGNDYKTDKFYFRGVKSDGTSTDQPDLIIKDDSIKVNPEEVKPGDTVTLKCTVENKNGVAGANILKCYLSSDETVDGEDAILGTSVVKALEKDETTDFSESVTIPADTVPGDYYILFWVDADRAVRESNEDNNLGSKQITMQLPDLIVQEDGLKVEPDEIIPGTTLTLGCKVKNSGSATAGASVLTYYLSSDVIVGPEDSALGTSNVNSLESGMPIDVGISIKLPININSGGYYILFVADTGENVVEKSESNNLSYKAVTVILPDLIVQNISGVPDQITAGAILTLGCTVKNQGTAAAGANILKYYLSTDATVGSGDTVLGSTIVEALKKDESKTDLNTSVTIPSNIGAGSYYILFEVDADKSVRESNEDNNVTFKQNAAGLPDLIVQDLEVLPLDVKIGEPLVLKCEVKNEGETASGASMLKYYLSSDEVVGTDDIVLSSSVVNSLEPGGTSSIEASTQIPSNTESGVYYILFWVDADENIIENNETNNLSDRQIKVISPDLIVQNLTGVPEKATAGEPLTLGCEVRNQGKADAGPNVVTYYISSDKMVDSEDAILGSSVVKSLSRDGSSGLEVSTIIPYDTNFGVYYILFMVDADNTVAENNELNNLAYKQIIIVLPDLIVQPDPTVDPTELAYGDTMTITCSVKNQGTTDADANVLKYYLSTDTVFDASDDSIGYTDVEPTFSYSVVRPLAVDEIENFNVTAIIPNNTGPGVYYILFIVDDNKTVPESNEDNNLAYMPIVVKTKPDVTAVLTIGDVYGVVGDRGDQKRAMTISLDNQFTEPKIASLEMSIRLNSENNLANELSITFGEYWLHVESVAGFIVGESITGEVHDYIDRLNGTYNGSDGTESWTASPWVEIGENDGAESGNVQVSSNYIRITANSSSILYGISRCADISGYGTAQLSFDYQRVSFDNNDDYINVDISTNGGAWTNIIKYEGMANDAGFQAFSYDLTDYVSPNTCIRFQTSSDFDESDIFNIDNIKITLIDPFVPSPTTGNTATADIIAIDTVNNRLKVNNKKGTFLDNMPILGKTSTVTTNMLPNLVANHYGNNFAIPQYNLSSRLQNHNFDFSFLVDPNYPNFMHITLYSLTGDVIEPGNGPLLELLFDANNNWYTQATLGIESCVIASDQNAAREITADFTDTGTYTATCSCDVNGDTFYDVADLQLVINCDRENVRTECDNDYCTDIVNNDGVTNILDFQAMLDKLLTPALPCPPRSRPGRTSSMDTVVLDDQRMNQVAGVSFNLDNNLITAAMQVKFVYDATQGLDIIGVNLTSRTSEFTKPVFQKDSSDPQNTEITVLLFSLNGKVIQPGSGSILNFVMVNGQNADPAMFKIEEMVVINSSARALPSEDFTLTFTEFEEEEENLVLQDVIKALRILTGIENETIDAAVVLPINLKTAIQLLQGNSF